MDKELQNLVNAKQLKAEPSTAGEIETLLRRSAGFLTDAGNATLGPGSRFALAYDAAFALANAALRRKGYRPDTARGHRAIVFQTLPHTIGAPTELWTALSAAHDRRNAMEYGAAIAPSATEATDLLTQARKLDTLVRALVGKHLP